MKITLSLVSLVFVVSCGIIDAPYDHYSMIQKSGTNVSTLEDVELLIIKERLYERDLETIEKIEFQIHPERLNDLKIKENITVGKISVTNDTHTATEIYYSKVHADENAKDLKVWIYREDIAIDSKGNIYDKVVAID
ncbi:MAG TPA: hypothetical protein VJH88_02865 [Candidatus Nanoarchaeia archaeon]|nr:hypothetical protein [Candidatus Nanoarchaeia archaeon]